MRDEDRGSVVRAVDRLLDSPHYGERWARQWLDAARYADSDGYEKDKSRQVWFYRDWVIAALNRDLPYDQFIIEQIAGDQLPNPTQEQLVATGYLRNSMLNEEGGIDPEQFRMEAMFDRMDAIGKGVLGVTIQCAQCHDHKFDPLSQEDYYRMFAFLNNAHEANIAVYTPTEQLRRAELFRKVAEIEGGSKNCSPTGRRRWPLGKRASREISRSGPLSSCWETTTRKAARKYRRVEDGSIVAQGLCPHEARPKIDGADRRPPDHRLSPGAIDRSEFAAERPRPLDLRDRGADRVWRRGNSAGRAVPKSRRVPKRAHDQQGDASAAAKPDLAARATIGNAQGVKIAGATADVNPPETPLPAIYDDRSNRRRVTGPSRVCHRRQ